MRVPVRSINVAQTTEGVRSLFAFEQNTARQQHFAGRRNLLKYGGSSLQNKQPSIESTRMYSTPASNLASKSSFAWLVFFLLFWDLTQTVTAQAVVGDTRQIQVPASYESVLKRMDGEEASRKMFASQHLELLEYSPRKKQENAAKDNSKVTAKIDILGRSCEYGLMRYLLSVEADDESAIIEVSLAQPVGMIRSQAYRYTIVPNGESETSILIEHTLDVVLSKRRLELINRIIEKVTYQKACEQLLSLTANMTRCVQSIASITEPKDPEERKEVLGDDDSPEMGVDSSDEKSAYLDEKAEKQAKNSENTVIVDPSPAANQAAESSDLSKSEATKLQVDGTPSPAKQLDVPGGNEENSGAERVSKEAEKPMPNQTQADRARTANSDDAKADSTKENPVLRITIDGVAKGAGSMRIAIFDSEKQYLAFDARNEESKQGDAFRKEAVPVTKAEKLIYEFKDVPFGRYAIAAFHDMDGNGKLNSSLIGMPSEPYGFSRNARGTLGAPKFGDAVITFDKGHNEFSFRVK